MLSGSDELFRLIEEAVENATALRTHGSSGAPLRILPDGVRVHENGGTFGRQVQAATASAGWRIHRDVSECQEALEIAGQCRLFDIEFVPDLDSRDAIARSELSQ